MQLFVKYFSDLSERNDFNVYKRLQRTMRGGDYSERSDIKNQE
jgi:hypothetical protein